jgi:hypothetical protein
LQANKTGNQRKIKELLQKFFNKEDDLEYKNQIPPTTEKYNPFKQTMWEYVYHTVVNGVSTEVSRGELELLSQKILIGDSSDVTGLIMKFRGSGILPQECHTRDNVICCKSEGDKFGYFGHVFPFSQGTIDG